MNGQKWEYKVMFVEGWQRISIEGHETRPQEGERNSAFGRRMLNQLGSEGWELSGIQHTMPGRSYMIFKRPMAEGTEPDLSVVHREAAPRPEGEQAPPAADGPQVVSL